MKTFHSRKKWQNFCSLSGDIFSQANPSLMWHVLIICRNSEILKFLRLQSDILISFVNTDAWKNKRTKSIKLYISLINLISVNACLKPRSEVMLTGRKKQEATERSYNWNNSTVQQQLTEERLFWHPAHRLQARCCPLQQRSTASSTESAHCFPSPFPEDVRQARLPKRWGQSRRSLFPRPTPGWVWIRDEPDLQSGGFFPALQASPLVKHGML